MKGKVIYKGGKASYWIHQGRLLGWKKVSKRAYDRAFPDKPLGVPMGAPPSCWPLKSVGAGTLKNAGARKRAMKRAAARGVPTEFTSDGEAVFRDRKHRRDYLRAFGIHDNSAGYSD